jgi:hypothetical protein
VKYLVCLLSIVALFIVPRPSSAAELDARTAAAYDQHVTELTQAFARQTGGEAFLDHHGADDLARMRRGEILLAAGTGDGITNVPRGLIHHWRAAAFIPNITLERLLMIVQDYSAYADVYDWVIASQLVARAGDRYRSFFRVKQSAGVVTGVVDVWMVTDYRRIKADRAIATAKAECVRQVEHAGERDETRLRQGTGSGYIWRANALSKYLERDGGVYVELDTIGLSRGYPALLGWIIEPVARRLGRDSARGSLNRLRAFISAPSAPIHQRDVARPNATWCGE